VFGNEGCLKKNRRKRFVFIERDFEYRFALKICFIGGGVFLFFTSTLLYVLKLNYETFLQEALIQFPEVVKSLKREFRFLLFINLAALVVMLSSLFALGIILGQRISGPIFAFKRRLIDLAENKGTVRLTLRDRDEFQNLVDVFNHAMESVEMREQALKQKIESLEKTKTL
jgi:methyl-accepting chemotaxis protein